MSCAYAGPASDVEAAAFEFEFEFAFTFEFGWGSGAGLAAETSAELVVSRKGVVAGMRGSFSTARTDVGTDTHGISIST